MKLKKFVYTNSITINSSLPTVFNASLFYPHFVSIYSYKNSSLIKKKIKVEVGVKILFFEIRWKGTGLIFEKIIRYRQTSGILVGLISKWIFNKEYNYTRVTIAINFRQNVFMGYIFLILLSYIVKKILIDLKYYVLTKDKQNFLN